MTTTTMSNEILFFIFAFFVCVLVVFYLTLKDIKTQVDLNTDNIVEVAKSLKDTQDVVKNNSNRLDGITLLRATGDIKKNQSITMKATISYSKADLIGLASIFKYAQKLPTEQQEMLDKIIENTTDDTEIDITDTIKDNGELNLGLGLIVLGLQINKYAEENGQD